MLARLCALLLSGLLGFGVLAAGGSRGLTQAVDVVVLVDRSAAEYGDTINVTAYVFDHGAPAEPSEISAVIDKLPGISPLPLIRQSIGIFRGTFAFESHPTVVTVNATVGTAQDWGGAVVWHTFDQVSVIPSAGTATPGQTITVAVETHDGEGRLRDADFVNVTADISYAPGYREPSGPKALPSTRTSVGTYSAVYTVPKDINRDAIVAFRADVVRGRGGSGVGAQVYVAVPDSLLVWYRPLAINGSNVTLEIDVATLTGAPVSNASISFRMWSSPGSVMREFQGTSDRSGAARFDLSLSSIAFGFYGNASLGPQRQPFSGGVSLFPVPIPGEPGVSRENPDEFFPVGDTAVLRFRLAKGNSPVPNQELFVYAHTTSRVILAERIQTDGAGRFEIRFVVPPNSVSIDMAASIDGAWKAFHDGFFAVNPLPAIASSPDGWHLTISGRFPGRPEPWMARLSLSAKGEALAGPWIATGSFGPARIASGFGGEAFAFDVSLPRFLPVGEEVSLSIWAESFRGDFAVLQRTVVTGAPIVPQTDVTVLVPILGLGIVIAIPASGWRWRRHRNR